MIDGYKDYEMTQKIQITGLFGSYTLSYNELMIPLISAVRY